MIDYFKHFDSAKIMSFKFNDNRLIKKCTGIWEKVTILMSIEFKSEPVYGNNDKYNKAKIKSYGDKINTVIRESKKYYPQTLLDEWKKKIKKTRMENLVN